MGKYKVIVTARSFGKADDQALRLLEEHGCDVVRLAAGDAAFDEQIKKEITAADAVIAGLDAYSGELIDSAERLKVISRYGVGYDKVDVEAANRKGILVTITPGANGDSVADLAVTLMLDAARNVAAMDAAMKGRAQARPQGVEMWQKTLGVIGTGRIGQGVARRCRGFDMKILCYDIYENEASFHDFFLCLKMICFEFNASLLIGFLHFHKFPGAYAPIIFIYYNCFHDSNSLCIYSNI